MNNLFLLFCIFHLFFIYFYFSFIISRLFELLFIFELYLNQMFMNNLKSFYVVYIFFKFGSKFHLFCIYFYSVFYFVAFILILN